jgi:hypothetical protein
MIQITPQMRLLLAVEPVDFRQGIDGRCPSAGPTFTWWLTTRVS